MKVTLQQMLAARENRAEYQKYLLKKYCNTLISFTLNIPGEKKQCLLYQKVHAEGMQEILALIKKENIVWQQSRHITTGSEGFIVVDEDSLTVKKLVCTLEEKHVLGRLFDIDVFTPEGKLIPRTSVGLDKRKCLLCEDNAVVCSRLQRHKYQELVTYVDAKIQDFFRQGAIT